MNPRGNGPYAVLGYTCTQHSNALTSNHKYLLPTNEVYDKFYTKMRRYPGDIGIYGHRTKDDRAPHDPSHLKAFFSKDSAPDGSQSYGTGGGCSSCNKN